MSKRLLKGEREYYARNLPHWQPKNAVLFMTTRLYGSLPKNRIQELKEQKEAQEQMLKSMGLSKEELNEELRKCYDLYFGKFDALLDGNKEGPH